MNDKTYREDNFENKDDAAPAHSGSNANPDQPSDYTDADTRGESPETPIPEREKTIEELLEDEKNARKNAEETLLRLRADFENFRRRLVKEKEEALKYANESLLGDLLPVIDNFELGLMAAENATDTKVIIQGFSMVKSQLGRFLEEVSVSVIDATDKDFDPKFHDAVGEEFSDSVPEGKVLSQRRKGYLLKERLLRPATVVVSKGKPVTQTNTAQEPAPSPNPGGNVAENSQPS